MDVETILHTKKYRTLFCLHVATTPRRMWLPTELSVSEREEQNLSIKAWNPLIKLSLSLSFQHSVRAHTAVKLVKRQSPQCCWIYQHSTATDGPTFSVSSGTILILGRSRCKIVTKWIHDTLLFCGILFWLACHIFYALCLASISSVSPLLYFLLCSPYQPSKWIKPHLVYAVLQPYLSNPLIQILHLFLCAQQENHIQ